MGGVATWVPLSIRPRAATDLPAIVEAFNTADYPANANAEGRSARLTKHHAAHAWVAVAAAPLDQVVGHVALSGVDNDSSASAWESAAPGWADKMWVVNCLLVSPVARRQGLGRSLLLTAVRHAHRHSRLPVLDVLTENQAALSLYAETGFEVVGLDWDGMVTVMVGPSPEARSLARQAA